MKKILLTGATGFVGSYLLDSIDIHRVVLRTKNKLAEFPTANTYSIGALDASTNWNGAFFDVDIVIHLAALAHNKNHSLDSFQNVNVDGTLHLAREAVKAGVKRFVFVSSIGVNGISTQNESFTPASTVYPHNAYTHSKYNAELGLKKIAQETGLEVVIVRPTLVYGPHAPGNFGLLTKLVEKLPVLPFGLTKNRRDFISVQNLADLLVTCARHPNAAGHTFLASEGETVSTKEFTDAIAIGLNKKIIQLPIPVSVMRLTGRLIRRSSMVEQLVGNLEVDSSNLKEVLNWTPPLTMRQAMESLRASGTQ